MCGEHVHHIESIPEICRWGERGRSNSPSFEEIIFLQIKKSVVAVYLVRMAGILRGKCVGFVE